MFLRNCWQAAAFAKEIVPGQMLARRIADEPIVFFRASDGKAIAFEDRCPHRSAPLSKGMLLRDAVQCGYHGMRYDLTGKCTFAPGQSFIPPKAKVRVYPVVERYRIAWIWMGDPERADPHLVPDVHWMDDPQWVAAEGYHLIHANYKLLNDNLLDLSHETYVHGRTIGHDSVAETPVDVRTEDGAVHVVKEIDRCHAPPFYQYLARVPADADIRRWQRTIYRPPGYVMIDVGVEPLAPIPGSNKVEAWVIDLITPETEATSHYFWAFARNFRLNEPEVTEFTRDNVRRTFDEDKEMLEAQQSVLGTREVDPAYKVALKADAGAMQGRRLLDGLIAAERSAAEEGAVS